MLPTFDLPAFIAKYNAENHTDYSLEETFGFDYFESELLVYIQGTLEYIYHGTESVYFTMEEKIYQRRERAVYLEQARQFAQQEIAEAPTKPPCEEAVQSKIFYRQWVLVNQSALNDDKNWRAWSARASNFNLARIRAVWESQRTFAHHTHAALLEAMTLLEKLIKYYREVQFALASYWNRRHIPAAILAAFQEHISAFFDAAEQTKQAMLESMAGRLHAWSHGEESVVVHTVKKVLKSSNTAGATLEQEGAFPPVAETLTAHQFAAFHHAIDQWGNPHTKKRLQHLPWRSKVKQKSLHLATIRQEHLTVVVPEVLASDIPKKKPLAVFMGARLRYGYFWDKEQFLALLTKPTAAEAFTVDINDVASFTKNLTAVCSKEALLNQAINQVNSDIAPLSTMRQRQSIRFLKTWQGLLENARIKQLRFKLSLAEKWLESMQQYERFTLIQAGTVCVQIKQLLFEIQQNMTAYQLASSGISKHFERIQLSAAKYLSGHRAYQAIAQYSEQKVLPLSELLFIAEYVEGLRAADNLAAFANITEPLLNVIATHLKQQLQADNFRGESNNKQEVIKQGDILIDKLGTPSQKRHWRHQRIKYFHRYLEAKKQALQPEQQDDEKIQMGLHHAEQLLLHIGKDITYCDSHTTIASIIRQISNQKSDSQRLSLIGHYQELSITINNELLVGRINKDITVFRANVLNFLESPENNLSRADINRILEICDRAIEENKKLEDIAQDKCDKTLLGLNKPQDKSVKPLLEAYVITSRAHQLISKKASIAHNKEQLNQIKAHLSNPTYKNTFGDLVKSRSGKRLLFIQDNINTEITESSDRNTITPSALGSINA